MIKVEFTYTTISFKNFNTICKKLSLKYYKDNKYKPHFYGCNNPDVGYIVETDNFNDLKKLANKKLFVENLIEYK